MESEPPLEIRADDDQKKRTEYERGPTGRKGLPGRGKPRLSYGRRVGSDEPSELTLERGSESSVRVSKCREKV